MNYRALCCGDLHLSDRPPSSCTDSYLDDLFVLLDDVELIAKERGVYDVVFDGDIFHVKTPSRTSHRTILRFIEWCARLRDQSITVRIVPGNHDMQHDRLESVFETQPLGVVFASGAALPLVRSAAATPLCGLPWPLDYRDRWALRSVVEGASLGDLVVAHMPFYPPGQEPPWESFRMVDFNELLPSGVKCVHYGHVHERHGVTEVGGVRYCNFGALTRGSLHEYDLTRTPAVALWDQNSQSFEEIKLPSAKPASAVFRLAEAKESAEAKERLDEFLSQVGATTLDVLSIESVVEHVRSLELEPAVTDLVIELISSVSG